MDLMDETRLAMAVYRARGFPQTPDRELVLRDRTLDGPAAWFSRLTPDEQARMRAANRVGMTALHFRTVIVPAELHEQAERAAKAAGYAGIEALVAAKLKAFVEYGDYAAASGPDAGWTPVPL